MFLGGKNVKICDFGQKKRSDSGEDLFFCLFGDHVLLVGKFVISARKSLLISAKTFAPLILILPPPRSREAGDAPAPKRGLCPEKINRLGATGVQIETEDTRLGVCRPRIRMQELHFRIFVNFHRISFKFWDEDLFFFGLHFRNRGKSQEFLGFNQILWEF